MSLGILEQRLGPASAGDLRDLQEEVQEISSLVNELLSFSKASLGSAPAVLKPVAVRSVLERAVRRECNTPDQVQLDAPENLEALGDAELLQRAFANLLRNSIRYAGGDGPIIVSAASQPHGVEIRFRDSGPGVPPAELPKLFDPFYRVDTSRDRTTGGVGLGLSIVKTCIESCGGTVTCHNAQPRGFEVVILLRKP